MTELADWQSDWLYQLIFREAARLTAIERQPPPRHRVAAATFARMLERLNLDDAKLREIVASSREQTSRYKLWQFVLIVEVDSNSRMLEEGKPQRAWIQDANGLRAITNKEAKKQLKRIGGRLYPFVLVSFAISDDRGHVDMGVRHADTAAFGERHRVVGHGEAAMLEHDPAGPWFIS